jgi:molybdenum cofactor cytidylyltransferase
MRDDRSGPVAGVLLAAGTSSRMGRNKLLLRLEGEAVVHRAARCCLGAGLDPVLVVVGFEADRVSGALADLRVRLVQNPDFSQGINTSLRAGVAAVKDCAAAVVVLADMPLLTAEMIAALVNRYRDSDAPLVISDYGGVSAPPTLYARSLFPELQESDGEGCGKRVVHHHRGEAIAVPWPAELLADLDILADIDRIRTVLSARKASCAATS